MYNHAVLKYTLEVIMYSRGERKVLVKLATQLTPPIRLLHKDSAWVSLRDRGVETFVFL